MFPEIFKVMHLTLYLCHLQPMWGYLLTHPGLAFRTLYVLVPASTLFCLHVELLLCTKSSPGSCRSAPSYTFVVTITLVGAKMCGLGVLRNAEL